MRVPPHYIYVYRNDTWKEISSNELLPGDIVSVIDGSSLRSVKEEDKENNILFRIIKKIKEMKKREEEANNQKSINTVLNKYKEKEVLPVTCDMIILTGSAIVNESMLNGESIPQIKDSISKMEQLQNYYLDIKNKHKKLIIFAGTKVVKIEKNERKLLPKNVKSQPPDKGIICLVIKTGFSTSQGKILHKLLYNNQKKRENKEKEDIILIGILLLIAIIASCYVLIEGIIIDEILTYKLILRCIIIITSIIPPDLPIVLSLINNKSLSFLESKRIVCVEPYRIPLAGKVDICCFDKTGTLTSDEFIVKGVVDANSYELESVLDVNEETFSIILGCNSLIDIDGRLIGDPIEIAMFKELGGKIDKKEIICKNKIKINPIRKYIFESDLKKMTVLAKISSEKHKKKIKRVLCKGAPEIIKNLLKNIPQNYDECYLKWAKKGYMILALAYKDNEMLEHNTKREELEKNLIFSGFIIFETPLKLNIDKYIRELIKAKYNICLITGDHLLSTLKIARDLKIGPDNFLSLTIENNIMKWSDLDNNYIKETNTIEEIKNLSNDYTLGMTGKEYEKINLINNNITKKHEIIQYIKLFCRISQTQKNEIIKDLIKCGKYPSMCGDGSNDVGALKLATIGVVMLNIKESKIQKKEPFNFLSLDDETSIKNWDATSVASFTSKSDSIKCVKNIFVQGRCALVTNIQMYKIFIINSLLTIYIESILALKGIKFSENQLVYLGFLTSMFFLMFSKATPLYKLNSNKPPISIFTLASFISIIGQVIVHIISINLLIYATENFDPLSVRLEKSLDEKFSPNVINTILFLFQILNQSIIFVVNYKGEPFMDNIFKNSSMMKILFGIFSIGSIIIFDLYPQLNEDFELVTLPEDNNYKIILSIIMMFNFVFCYLFEKWKNVFGLYEPYEKNKIKKRKN